MHPILAARTSSAGTATGQSALRTLLIASLLLPTGSALADFDRLRRALDGHASAVYEGGRRGGRREGRGVLAWPDGRVYRGQFWAGLPDGEGVLTWPDGTRFEGLLRDGRILGEARVEFADGSRYRGPLVDGLPDGLGSFRWPDRARYTGEYSEGMRHGWGEHKRADGTRYVGGFYRDERAGQGTLIRKDGTLIRGSFLRGRFHGHLVRVSPKGRSLTLEFWEDGIRKRTSTIRESTDCRLRHGDRRWMVQGDACARKGAANGTGRAVSTDGTLFIPRGRFEQGRLVEGEMIALGQPPAAEPSATGRIATAPGLLASGFRGARRRARFPRRAAARTAPPVRRGRAIPAARPFAAARRRSS